MLCTECKKEQEKRIPNEEKENAQPAEKVCSDVHTTLKSKRSAALILVTGATLMLIMVFILFWLIMLPNLPQDNSVLANNYARPPRNISGSDLQDDLLLPSGGSFFVLWRFYKLFTVPALTSYSFGGIIIQYDIRCLSYDRS